jgi:hypothetical protein
MAGPRAEDTMSHLGSMRRLRASALLPERAQARMTASRAADAVVTSYVLALHGSPATYAGQRA